MNFLALYTTYIIYYEIFDHAIVTNKIIIEVVNNAFYFCELLYKKDIS